jgi:rhodanese-related sulfurtransferase
MSLLHPGVPAVRATEAQQLLDDGAVMIDVREPFEYHAEHAPDARLLPLSELPGAVRDLEDDRTIVVVCRSGSRSASATRFLKHQGLDAVNLSGGMIAWVNAGLPTRRG